MFKKTLKLLKHQCTSPPRHNKKKKIVSMTQVQRSLLNSTDSYKD